MELLIGLDIGTTALKVALFDTKGTLLAVSTQEYDLLTPQTNFVEEEPEVYWKAFLDGMHDLKRQHEIDPEDKVALAMSAQGETLLFLDKEGRSLRNAIVWMDNRAEEEAKELRDRFGNDTCYQVTGQIGRASCRERV